MIGALAAMICVGGLTSAAQAAGKRPCIPGTRGPKCTIWKAKVTFVADGDTIEVNVAGDGSSRRDRVRLTGIQAMEQSRYSSDPSKRRGQCHALAATARLEQLLRQGGNTVRLAAQNRRSRTGTRIRRSVSTRIGGHWVDVQQALVSEGLALWLPNSVEYAWNRSYSILAQRAAASGVGLWNRSSCGAGPGDENQLRLWVDWDANGDDSRNGNGEWVKIKNTDPTRAISLAQWWFRDSDLRRYSFPSWATIPAGATITLRIGRGTSRGRTLYWGQRRPVFENATGGARAMGDGGYLFDPQGDLRAWMNYPCRDACADPLRNPGATR